MFRFVLTGPNNGSQFRALGLGQRPFLDAPFTTHLRDLESFRRKAPHTPISNFAGHSTSNGISSDCQGYKPNAPQVHGKWNSHCVDSKVKCSVTCHFEHNSYRRRRPRMHSRQKNFLLILLINSLVRLVVALPCDTNAFHERYTQILLWFLILLWFVSSMLFTTIIYRKTVVFEIIIIFPLSRHREFFNSIQIRFVVVVVACWCSFLYHFVTIFYYFECSHFGVMDLLVAVAFRGGLTIYDFN